MTVSTLKRSLTLDGCCCRWEKESILHFSLEQEVFKGVNHQCRGFCSMQSEPGGVSCGLLLNQATTALIQGKPMPVVWFESVSPRGFYTKAISLMGKKKFLGPTL